MQDKVYVVIGETGEWADASQWNVCAYLDKSLADQHAQTATDAARSLGVLHIDDDTHISNELQTLYNPNPPINPFDALMEVDTNGVSYRVVEIPLRAELFTLTGNTPSRTAGTAAVPAPAHR
jgi:hypothetical protein